MALPETTVTITSTPENSWTHLSNRSELSTCLHISAVLLLRKARVRGKVEWQAFVPSLPLTADY